MSAPSISSPSTSSFHSPVLFDSPGLSSFLWICGLIGGMGLLLAAYDPSSVSFLGPQASELDILACSIGGSLVTLVSGIQLIRLIAPSRLPTNQNVQKLDANAHEQEAIVEEQEALRDPIEELALARLLHHIMKEMSIQSRYDDQAVGYIFAEMSSALESAMRAGQDALILHFVREIADWLPSYERDNRALPIDERELPIRAKFFKEVFLILSENEQLLKTDSLSALMRQYAEAHDGMQAAFKVFVDAAAEEPNEENMGRMENLARMFSWQEFDEPDRGWIKSSVERWIQNNPFQNSLRRREIMSRLEKIAKDKRDNDPPRYLG